MSSDDVLTIRKEGEPVNSVDEQANRLTETLGKAFLSHRITLDDCRRIVAEVLKTTRQEALREACKLVSDYNCMHDHGKKATKACDDIFEQLDRLASEGAPAPIDLLPKLNDDGGYGEHF